MRVTTLSSGSKGNCVYVEGESGALLIDAGLSVREILSRLSAAGGKADLIHSVLVTHEHGDHIRGVAALARRLGIPVTGSAGTLSRLPSWSSSTRLPDRITCRPGTPFRAGEFTVHPFSTSHDAREPLGYCVQEGGIRLGCCTDTGILTPAMMEILGRCDMLILESNHCPDLLRNGPYPEVLKRRIRSRRGHLSNQAAAAGLQTLGAEVPVIQLAHLSEINNTPARALSAARAGLGLFGDQVDLLLALQHGVSPSRTL